MQNQLSLEQEIYLHAFKEHITRGELPEAAAKYAQAAVKAFRAAFPTETQAPESDAAATVDTRAAGEILEWVSRIMRQVELIKEKGNKGIDRLQIIHNCALKIAAKVKQSEMQAPESAPVIQTPAPVQTRYPWHEAPDGAVFAGVDKGSNFAYWYGFRKEDSSFGAITSVSGEFYPDDWQNSLELNPALFQSEHPPFEPGDLVVSKITGFHRTVAFCGKEESGEWLFVAKNLFDVFACEEFVITS